MRLTPMRFKEYTWPHNPETYSVEFRRRVAALKIPFGGYCLQDLGEVCRILKGQGTFAGSDAYQQFQSLAAVFYQEGSGLLVHPVWQTANAYFVSLKLEEQPLPDYVRYSFEFWEDRGKFDGKLTEIPAPSPNRPDNSAAEHPASANTYIVRKGDTLWGIAKRYGVALTALISANPQIKNPNLIYPGNEVRIP